MDIGILFNSKWTTSKPAISVNSRVHFSGRTDNLKSPTYFRQRFSWKRKVPDFLSEIEMQWFVGPRATVRHYSRILTRLLRNSLELVNFFSCTEKYNRRNYDLESWLSLQCEDLENPSTLNFPFTGKLTSRSRHNAHNLRTNVLLSLPGSSHTHEILRAVEIKWDDYSNNSTQARFLVLFHKKLSQRWHSLSALNQEILSTSSVSPTYLLSAYLHNQHSQY